jgi:hypothetical protein
MLTRISGTRMVMLSTHRNSTIGIEDAISASNPGGTQRQLFA